VSFCILVIFNRLALARASSACLMLFCLQIRLGLRVMLPDLPALLTRRDNADDGPRRLLVAEWTLTEVDMAGCRPCDGLKLLPCPPGTGVVADFPERVLQATRQLMLDIHGYDPSVQARAARAAAREAERRAAEISAPATPDTHMAARRADRALRNMEFHDRYRRSGKKCVTPSRAGDGGGSGSGTGGGQSDADLARDARLAAQLEADLDDNGGDHRSSLKGKRVVQQKTPNRAVNPSDAEEDDEITPVRSAYRLF